MIKLQQLLNAKNNAGLTADGIIGAKSIAALHNYVTAELKKRNWVMPADGLVWIRTDDRLTDTFDDFVAVYQGGVCVAAAPCSTTAGDYYIYNPITYGGITGTAVAQEQQVLQCHRFVTDAKWSNLWLKAPYFQQIRDIGIFRDGNKDRQLDTKITQRGNFGINMHRGWGGNRIYNASAGCLVVPDAYWFEIQKRFKLGQLIDFTLFVA